MEACMQPGRASYTTTISLPPKLFKAALATAKAEGRMAGGLPADAPNGDA